MHELVEVFEKYGIKRVRFQIYGDLYTQVMVGEPAGVSRPPYLHAYRISQYFCVMESLPLKRIISHPNGPQDESPHADQINP